MNTTTAAAPKRPLGFWIIGLFALVWNLIGVAMWYLQVNMSAEQLAALGMLLKKKWAATMFLLSLIALLVQMIGAYVVTPAWSAYGPVGLVMPAVLLAIALFLLWYANKAQARSWLS